MAQNPFENLTTDPPAITTINHPAAQRRGGTLIFDFETVPDESRFPRPVAKVHTDIVDLEDIITGGVPDVVKQIELGLSPEQLADLEKLERESKKPRKGVLDAIASAVNASGAEFAAWKKDCSVNPFAARICAFGWAVGSDSPQSMMARTNDEERAILRKFWELIESSKKRCGYNIFGFDDMLAIVRSMLLKVQPSRPLDRRRYGNREAIDLMLTLFPASGAKPCKDVCHALGIVPPAGEMDGSKVFDLYEAGDMASIAKYVESDVAIERELLIQFGEYLEM